MQNRFCLDSEGDDRHPQTHSNESQTDLFSGSGVLWMTTLWSDRHPGAHCPVPVATDTLVFTVKAVKDNWMDETKASRYKLERLDKRGSDDGNKLLTKKWWGRKNLRRVKGKVAGKERLNKNKQLRTGTRKTKANRPALYKTKRITKQLIA